MRNLANLLVHLFSRNGDLDRIYLTSVHDRCLFCEEEISETSAYRNYRVCPYCRFHYTLSARQRIELLADRRSFKESYKYLSSVAPIAFSQRGSYRNLLSQSQNRTGLTEATVTGICRIGGIRTMLVVLDFGFMGGSMGSVVGEKIALGLETAARRDLPLVALVTGGGARIQEGVLSLMQMAKTVTAANRFKEKGAPFIVVLANPSTGQAYASFANLADVILAEPGSLIGLSPLRTLREASEAPLPQDAHTAEAHLHHGLLDNVVDRESLQPRLATLLRVLTAQKLGKGEFKPPARTRSRPGPGPEAWESVTAARNGERPSATFYIRSILEPFVELHGDRLSSDDRSIIAGVGYLCGEPVAVIGQQRPYSLDGERYHIYPDGLRKAQRLIKLATRFELPLVTFIDTQGADPGLAAEEQGIGNAIATTLSMMAEAPVPIVSVIIGEGGQRRRAGAGDFRPHYYAAVRHLLAHFPEPDAGRFLRRPGTGPGGGGSPDADRPGLPGVGHNRRHRNRTGRGRPQQFPERGHRPAKRHCAPTGSGSPAFSRQADERPLQEVPADGGKERLLSGSNGSGSGTAVENLHHPPARRCQGAQPPEKGRGDSIRNGVRNGIGNGRSSGSGSRNRNIADGSGLAARPIDRQLGAAGLIPKRETSGKGDADPSGLQEILQQTEGRALRVGQGGEASDGRLPLKGNDVGRRDAD